jgi:hypothetical protein
VAIERHVIELTAKDGVTSVLHKVGQTAKQTGDQADAANKKAARSTQDWSTEAKLLGGVLGGVLAGGLALSVRSASNLQESISKSTVVFGDNAAEIRDWARDSAQSMGLSERSALEATATFGNLFTTMGLLPEASADMSKGLVELASDLASFNNIGTDEALEKLRAGLVGEIEPLRSVGINLSELAVQQELVRQGIERTNGDFTTAQKVQARYALILAQSANAQGDFARTSDGMANQMRIAQAEFDNAAASLGTALLPVATDGIHIIAELAHGFSMLPEPAQEAAAAMGVLSAGLLVLGPPTAKAIEAIKAVSSSATAAKLASAGLSLAMGPAGLLGGVGLLTAGLVYLVATTDEFSSSAQAAEEEAADLANSYAALAASIEDLAEREQTRQALAEFAGFQEQAQKDLRTYQELQNALVEWQSEFPQMESVAVGALLSIDEATQEWLDTFAGGADDGRIAIADLTTATEQFGQKALLTSDQASQIGESLTEALSHADVDISRILEDFDKIEQQWRAGEISGEQFANGVDEIARTWGTYTPFVLEAEEATVKVTDAIRFATHEWHAAVPVLGDLTSEVEANTEAMGNWYVANHASVPVIEAIVEQTGYATTGLGDLSTGADNTTTASYQLGAALADLGQHLEDDIPGQAGRAYNSIVGYTDGLVGSIQKIKDWSDELTAPLGTDFMANGDPSRLIQLMNQGKLDVEDYNEALEAQTRIYGDLARAQDASAVIQIRSASSLADGADATADYLESLSKLPEAELEVALAWADSDIGGRANEIAGMASEFGNMDDAQKAAFESMVESAAATDPQLAVLLESLGLIKKDVNDPTGWQLTIDDSSAQTSLGDVVDAIETLGAIILGIPDIDIDATLHTGGFWDVYNALPDSATIDVYYAYHGSIPQLALGGVVPWEGDTAAMGRLSAGRATLVGEAGPEIALLPGGTQVIPNHASRYMTPKGGGGGMNFAGSTFNFYGVQNPQQFMRQMRDYASTMERR